MKLKLERFNKLISDQDILKKSLEKTEKEYRALDPGWYLYNLLLDKRKLVDIFSDEYLELIYTTLISWNMNGRGAKLAEIQDFKDSIRSNKPLIISLKGYRLEKLDKDGLTKIVNVLKELFKKLKVVQTNSKLVTFSKTLHFLLPELIAPIDRKYTLEFFYRNTMLTTDKDSAKNDEKQFEVFEEIFEKYWELVTDCDLLSYLDDKSWNRTIPKIADNAVIGFVKLNLKE